MTDPIKAKIQELCPDVMELKFGCEIEYEEQTAFLTGETHTMGDAFGSVPARKFWVTNKRLNGIDSFHENGKEWKILGSPITLAVVLRAIDKTYLDSGYALMASNGWLSLHPKGRGYWDLTKDYDQQSEECKQFIGSLLGV